MTLMSFSCIGALKCLHVVFMYISFSHLTSLQMLSYFYIVPPKHLSNPYNKPMLTLGKTVRNVHETEEFTITDVSQWEVICWAPDSF